MRASGTDHALADGRIAFFVLSSSSPFSFLLRYAYFFLRYARAFKIVAPRVPLSLVGAFVCLMCVSGTDHGRLARVLGGPAHRCLRSLAACHRLILSPFYLVLSFAAKRSRCLPVARRSNVCFLAMSSMSVFLMRANGTGNGVRHRCAGGLGFGVCVCVEGQVLSRCCFAVSLLRRGRVFCPSFALFRLPSFFHRSDLQLPSSAKLNACVVASDKSEVQLKINVCTYLPFVYAISVSILFLFPRLPLFPSFLFTHSFSVRFISFTGGATKTSHGHEP